MKITTVKKAAKDYPEEGIEKGQEYHYCRPKKAGVKKVRRRTKEELQSWIMQYAKGFQGVHSSNMEEYRERLDSLDNEEDKDQLYSDIDEFLEEKRQSLENLPEQLQESHVLNEQISELEEILQEVENWEEE